MNKKELEIKKIVNGFSYWQVQIGNLTSLNLYDANLFSEDSICSILNVIFDYKLKNVNAILKNHPAIDLTDDYNKIAVQVTSTTSKTKIQDTINKFYENRLYNKYDELLIIILGNKKKYSNFIIPDNFSFDKEKHILDFKDLLRIINFLPINRIEKIVKLIEKQAVQKLPSNQNPNASKVKQNLAMKKKLKKDFLRKLKQEDWQRATYEPWIKFVYSQVLIRSVDDTTWPNTEEPKDGEISPWFKGEFWDFYDNGLELVSHGRRAIFDKDGNWDILGISDRREQNKNYQIVNFHPFLRIPYEYIVDYDMEPDDYNALPTIYVEYANEGMPYEEILYGTIGNYIKEDPLKSSLRYYFDNEKMKKLE